MSGEMTAEEDLRITLRAIREMGGGPEAIDAATARNVLHEELGYFSTKATSYSLDDITRDRLIVHGRQDAAHAVYAALRAYREVKKLRGLVSVLLIAIAVLIALQAWTLIR